MDNAFQFEMHVSTVTSVIVSYNFEIQGTSWDLVFIFQSQEAWENSIVEVIVGKNIMYLLTEWEGRTGKYLARGQGVRTERSEVRTSWPRAKYFPVRPDLTQSISILSYDHLLLKILKILFEPK